MAAPPPKCGEKLNADIWFLVLGLAGSFDPNHIESTDIKSWACKARLVSKTFDAALKPHAYAYINLDISHEKLEEILDKNSKVAREFLGNIQTFTRHLWLACEYNSQSQYAIVRLIGQCKRLEELFWPIQGRTQTDKESQFIATTYLKAFMLKQVSCGFRAQAGLTAAFKMTDDDADEVFSSGFNATESGADGNSLDLSHGKSDHASDSHVQVGGCHVVKVLHIDNNSKGSFTGFLSTGAPFPPMIKLHLCNYSWTQHQKDEIHRLWDLSCLRALSLERMDMIQFFKSLPIASIAQLRTIKLQNCNLWAGEEVEHRDVRQMELLFKGMINLERLDIICNGWGEVLSFKTLRHIARTLKSLHLRSSRYSEDLKSEVPAISVKRLGSILSSLQEFGLVYHAKSLQQKELLDSLAEFSELKRLTLYATASLSLVDTEANSTDQDYEVAEIIMRKLHTQKSGVPFDEITISLTDARLPGDWPLGGPFSHGNLKYEIWERKRQFKSRINKSGAYEQWGSSNFASPWAEKQDRMLYGPENESLSLQ